jgi:DNA-binding transcriptional LysR family regulator
MKLNNIDFNKIKCFQAVAEKGSLQLGASSLNLTPSAVYQSIKKLEEDLKKHLFFRSGKKYVLTDEGRNLQDLFQRFLWDLSQFQEKSLETNPNLIGELKIGLPLNFSKLVFIPLLTKFLDAHPYVKVHLTIAESRRLIEQISKFELDFAITDDSIPNEFMAKIEKKIVYREELVLVCSKKFHKENLASFKSIKLQKELPHLDYSKNIPLLLRWYKTGNQRTIKLEHFHTIDNVETMIAALKSGMGLGIIPRDLFNNKDLAMNLQIINSQTEELFNNLYLVQEGNYINNNLLKKFFQHLSTELGNISN